MWFVPVSLLLAVLSGCGTVAESQKNEKIANEQAEQKETPIITAGEVDRSADLVFSKANDCKARFTTSFDQVGVKYEPLQTAPSLALQLLPESMVRSLVPFTKNDIDPDNVALCDGLYKAILPFSFLESGRQVKNDLRVNIRFVPDNFTTLKPGSTFQATPQSLELKVVHQLAFGSSDNTRGKTLFRQSTSHGNITCPEPFDVSCSKSRNHETICVGYEITPPKGKCEISIPQFSAEIAQNKSLKGSLGGSIDFTNFEETKKAPMDIDHIEF